MSHGRKPRQPRHSAALNAVEMAINGARRLSDADVLQQVDLCRRALADYTQGRHCLTHWRSLADTANMAETLARMGLGGGEQAMSVIEQAQQALADAHQRWRDRGSWTLYADEIDALGWLISIHAVQLEACSYREFQQAYHRTRERVAQALAGNAAPGTVVISGVLGSGTEPQGVQA